MNVNPYNTTKYENKTNRTLGQNKPNQTQPVVSLSNLFPKGQNELKIACQKIWPHPTEHAITKKLEISWIVIILIRILTVRLETT